MRHINAHQNITQHILQPNQQEQDTRKILRIFLRLGAIRLRCEERVRGNIGHLCQCRLTAGPDFGFGRVVGNNILEVVLECVFVGGGFGVGDALVEFDDDACEAVFGDEDFLVVGDFADVAGENMLGLMTG